MRDINRIDKFAEYINPVGLDYLIGDIWELPAQDADIINYIVSNKIVIMDHWKRNPDYRFSQVLISLGFENYPGMWYYMEDEDILCRLQAVK